MTITDRRRPECFLSAVTNHLDDQVPSVLNAGAELGLSLLGVGADEEQPAVPDLGQRQGVMEVGDAAGSWKVLKHGGGELIWISKSFISPFPH